MATTIPKVQRSIAKAFSLRSWTKSKNFPMENYYNCIQGIFATLNSLGVTEPSQALIVEMLAACLDAEEALYAYVDGNDHDVGKSDVWKGVCTAAAWILLEGFEATQHAEGTKA